MITDIEKSISRIFSYNNEGDMSRSFGEIWSDSYTEEDFNELIYNFPKGSISRPYKDILEPSSHIFFWFSKTLCIGCEAKKLRYSLKKDISYFISKKAHPLRSLKGHEPSDWNVLSSYNLETLTVLIGNIDNIAQFINHPVKVTRHVALWRLKIGK